MPPMMAKGRLVMTSSATRAEPVDKCNSMNITRATPMPATMMVREADCCASNWPP